MKPSMELALELARWERVVADVTFEALQEWLPLVEEAVLPTLTAAGVPPNIDGMSVADVAWRSMVDARVLPTLERLMVSRIAGRLRSKGVAAPVASASAAELVTGGTSADAAVAYGLASTRGRQERFLGQARESLVRNPATVEALLRASVRDGKRAGESASQLRGRVSALMRAGRAGGWMKKAEELSRTVVTGAFNGASLFASQARQELTGVELHKVWLATMDGRTRPTHFAADGQRRKLDEAFSVGAASLDRPGDPTGPIEEIASCRCTTLELEAGDPLPGEMDRQTERGAGDATVRNREGSMADEIARRADKGILRARDDPEGEGSIAASLEREQGEVMDVEWIGVLAPLGKPTGDERIFAEDMELTFREFPLPLMWQQQTSDFPHSQAYTVGSIREASVVDGEIVASGILFADTDVADEVLAQIREGVTRPSVDLCEDEWELVDENGDPVTDELLMEPVSTDEDDEDGEGDEDGEEEETKALRVYMQFTAAKLMGATLVAKPAFAEARIQLQDEVPTEDEERPDDAESTPDEESDEESDDKAKKDEETAASVGARERALLASVPVMEVHDAKLFEEPSLHPSEGQQYDKKTGRVSGYLAVWDACHRGVQSECVLPPRSQINYADFHQHWVETDRGVLSVGALTVGGGHAKPGVSMGAALEHYDNAGSMWAKVRVGENEHGIWYSGVVLSSAGPQALAMALGTPLSGDWRQHGGPGGPLELCAALSVVTPGFARPSGSHDEHGRPRSLVAAGIPQVQRTQRKRKKSLSVREVAEAAVSAYAKRQASQESVRARMATMLRDDERSRLLQQRRLGMRKF